MKFLRTTDRQTPPRSLFTNICIGYELQNKEETSSVFFLLDQILFFLVYSILALVYRIITKFDYCFPTIIMLVLFCFFLFSFINFFASKTALSVMNRIQIVLKIAKYSVFTLNIHLEFTSTYTNINLLLWFNLILMGKYLYTFLLVLMCRTVDRRTR